jgi:hypothetical protein
MNPMTDLSHRHESHAGSQVLHSVASIVGVAAIVVAAIATGMLLTNFEPPVVGASQSAAPSTPMGPTATPSPALSPTPSPRRVATLITGPATCADDAAGFRLPVPDGWYANEAAPGIAPCRYFSAEPFELTDPDAPPEVAVRLSLVDTGDFGFTDREVVERSELRIAGLPALRLVTEGAGGQGLVYVIGLDGSLPSETNEGRFIYVITEGDGATIDRNTIAVKAMVAGLEIDSRAARGVGLGYGARLEIGADTAVRERPGLASPVIYQLAAGMEVVVTLQAEPDSTDPFFRSRPGRRLDVVPDQPACAAFAEGLARDRRGSADRSPARLPAERDAVA